MSTTELAGRQKFSVATAFDGSEYGRYVINEWKQRKGINTEAEDRTTRDRSYINGFTENRRRRKRRSLHRRTIFH